MVKATKISIAEVGIQLEINSQLRIANRRKKETDRRILSKTWVLSSTEAHELKLRDETKRAEQEAKRVRKETATQKKAS